MEFNFSRNDHPNVSYFLPRSIPPSNSLTTRHRVQLPYGGTVIGDYKTDYTGDYFNVRHRVERELEKEMIREEIIAEMARKQALEAEVRREILMERKFAVPMLNKPYDRMDNYDLTSRGIADLGRVENKPFQRCPGGMMMSEAKSFPQSNKGQLLLLPKTVDADLSETQMISKARPAARAAKFPAVGAKANAKEWSCALCQVSATSEQGLNDHIQGKKHKANVAKMKPTELHETRLKLQKKKITKNGKNRKIQHESSGFRKHASLNWRGKGKKYF